VPTTRRHRRHRQRVAAGRGRKSAVVRARGRPRTGGKAGPARREPWAGSGSEPWHQHSARSVAPRRRGHQHRHGLGALGFTVRPGLRRRLQPHANGTWTTASVSHRTTGSDNAQQQASAASPMAAAAASAVASRGRNNVSPPPPRRPVSVNSRPSANPGSRVRQSPPNRFRSIVAWMSTPATVVPRHRDIGVLNSSCSSRKTWCAAHRNEDNSVPAEVQRLLEGAIVTDAGEGRLRG